MNRQWMADSALDGFEATTIALPREDDGELVATVVRRRTTEGATRAVLHVHGFVDYFFHAHVADAFVAQGWDFYAIDLRRYGRSLRAGNRPNYVRDLAEYNEEITAAIDIVKLEEGHETLVVIGHSTGGLIMSLYAHGGPRCDEISGLVLNSPFFGFHLPWYRRMLLPIGDAVGRVLPFLGIPGSVPLRFFESLSAAHGGEWNYDERWKPLQGFPAYLGWIRAIRQGHARVFDGLRIPCPVLLLHSSKSMLPGASGDERHRTHDIVLDVAHMRAAATRLGRHVTVRAIDGGMHDLFLSPAPVRALALSEVFAWIATAIGEKRVAIREFRT